MPDSLRSSCRNAALPARNFLFSCWRCFRLSQLCVLSSLSRDLRFTPRLDMSLTTLVLRRILPRWKTRDYRNVRRISYSLLSITSNSYATHICNNRDRESAGCSVQYLGDSHYVRVYSVCCSKYGCQSWPNRKRERLRAPVSFVVPVDVCTWSRLFSNMHVVFFISSNVGHGIFRLLSGCNSSFVEIMSFLVWLMLLLLSFL